MNLRQAAEIALEALELTKKSWDWVNPKILDSITALRAALAEADEPVAWRAMVGAMRDE